jgi:CubicO group peptidase (beta-lactamase class C family)
MIEGFTDPRFAPLRAAFASCFADGLEHGGAVAVVIDGKLVADLWGGHADKARTKPWTRDTLVNVWSVSKGVVALAVAMLVERGALRYDDPVANAWPQFAAKGKERITLDLVLSHQAGLNGLDVEMGSAGLYAWHPYADALAAMAPLWEPGSRCVYHALSFGHLAGEPIRRVSGTSVGRFVAEEIAGPLGADFCFGLPEAQDHRAAEMIAGPKASDWVTAALAGPYPHACRNPTPVATQPNERGWRAAEIPGGNGQSNARALAAIYGNIVGSAKPLILREALAEATRLRFGSPVKYGAGFRIDDAAHGGRGTGTFGHSGWGGAVAFGDPAARLGFAYVTNNMLGFDDGIDPRRQRLIEAVYDAF